MRRITAPLTLTNHRDEILAEAGVIPPERVRRLEVEDAVIDRGAMRLALPQEVVERLGLPRLGTLPVTYANAQREIRPLVGEVKVHLQGREDVFTALVLPRGARILVGAIVLETLDWDVDMDKGRLVSGHPESPDKPLVELL